MTQTDRVATTVLNDKDFFDDFLNTLPDAYKVLGRQALTGDYFSFYLCDLVLEAQRKGWATRVRQTGRAGLGQVHAG